MLSGSVVPDLKEMPINNVFVNVGKIKYKQVNKWLSKKKRLGFL